MVVSDKNAALLFQAVCSRASTTARPSSSGIPRSARSGDLLRRGRTLAGWPSQVRHPSIRPTNYAPKMRCLVRTGVRTRRARPDGNATCLACNRSDLDQNVVASSHSVGWTCRLQRRELRRLRPGNPFTRRVFADAGGRGLHDSTTRKQLLNFPRAVPPAVSLLRRQRCAGLDVALDNIFTIQRRTVRRAHLIRVCTSNSTGLFGTHRRALRNTAPACVGSKPWCAHPARCGGRSTVTSLATSESCANRSQAGTAVARRALTSVQRPRVPYRIRRTNTSLRRAPSVFNFFRPRAGSPARYARCPVSPDSRSRRSATGVVAMLCPRPLFYSTSAAVQLCGGERRAGAVRNPDGYAPLKTRRRIRPRSSTISTVMSLGRCRLLRDLLITSPRLPMPDALPVHSEGTAGDNAPFSACSRR